MRGVDQGVLRVVGPHRGRDFLHLPRKHDADGRRLPAPHRIDLRLVRARARPVGPHAAHLLELPVLGKPDAEAAVFPRQQRRLDLVRARPRRLVRVYLVGDVPPRAVAEAVDMLLRLARDLRLVRAGPWGARSVRQLASLAGLHHGVGRLLAHRGGDGVCARRRVVVLRELAHVLAEVRCGALGPERVIRHVLARPRVCRRGVDDLRPLAGALAPREDRRVDPVWHSVELPRGVVRARPRRDGLLEDATLDLEAGLRAEAARELLLLRLDTRAGERERLHLQPELEELVLVLVVRRLAGRRVEPRLGRHLRRVRLLERLHAGRPAVEGPPRGVVVLHRGEAAHGRGGVVALGPWVRGAIRVLQEAVHRALEARGPRGVAQARADGVDRAEAYLRRPEAGRPGAVHAHPALHPAILRGHVVVRVAGALRQGRRGAGRAQLGARILLVPRPLILPEGELRRRVLARERGDLLLAPVRALLQRRRPLQRRLLGGGLHVILGLLAHLPGVRPGSRAAGSWRRGSREKFPAPL
mmetsp:Transcript_14536/g.43521  ORF Transcript_14536/g.43521 Transcript_14536/m.43521 type:complete len:528 (+) Transcript_14536:343-1926(+)